MATITSNLSPQIKDRLRRAILSEISDDSRPPKASPLAAKAASGMIAKPAANRPASKTLRKIEFKSDLLAEKAPANGEGVKLKTAKTKNEAALPAPLKSVLPKAVKKASIKSIKKNMPAKEQKINQIIEDKPVAKKKSGAKKSKRKIGGAGLKKTAAKKTDSRKSAEPLIKGLPDEPLLSKTKAAKIAPAKQAPIKKIFAPKPFTPIYEVEAEPQAAAAPSAKPKFGLYRSGFKPKAVPAKDESLEKIFQTSPKIQKAQKAALAQIGAEPKKGGKKFAWGKMLAGIVAIVIILVGFDIFGLYRLNFNDETSRQVAKILNLPAGAINGSPISLSDYLDNKTELSVALLQGREGVIDYSGKSEINDKVFYYLATEKLIKDKLAEYNQIVTDQAVDAQVAQLLTQTGGQAAAEKIVQNLYGMPLNDFKKNILKPMLEREALLSAIMDDDSVTLNADAKKKAAEVLQMALASSTKFAELAKQYSDDESSVNIGGDLGWVSKGQLDSSWEPLVFSAATGTVITSTVKSAYGYHIIKVEQKVTDKTTGAVSVKLRHILIKVDIDKYIREILAASSVKQYVK